MKRSRARDALYGDATWLPELYVSELRDTFGAQDHRENLQILLFEGNPTGPLAERRLFQFL